jgi:hypothetical protein
MKQKEARNYIVNTSSATTWTYQDLNINTNAKTEELPTILVIHNPTNEDVIYKVMDKSEGNATSRTGNILPATQSISIAIEEDEKPFYRIGIKLRSGSVSTDIFVNGLKYDLQRV